MKNATSDKRRKGNRAITLLALLIHVVLSGCGKGNASVTATADSPDGKRRAVLIEKDEFGRIDRNFDVFLDDLSSGHKKRELLFSSPDEGKPIGTERFIWSTEGRFLLLVGREFVVVARSDSLESGELLYLLYDTQTQKLMCNAKQTEQYPRFTSKDISTITWIKKETPK